MQFWKTNLALKRNILIAQTFSEHRRSPLSSILCRSKYLFLVTSIIKLWKIHVWRVRKVHNREDEFSFSASFTLRNLQHGLSLTRLLHDIIWLFQVKKKKIIWDIEGKHYLHLAIYPRDLNYYIFIQTRRNIDILMCVRECVCVYIYIYIYIYTHSNISS